jgi:hypothetical protein
MVMGSDERTALWCPRKSGARSLVSEPVAFVSDWKVLQAFLANWLGERSNVVTDDFVDRLAGRTEIEKVLHCLRLRIPA